MLDQRQQRYLKALDIPLWSVRDPSSNFSCDSVSREVDDSHETLGAWSSLVEQAVACQACPLHASRQQIVFGVGNTDADWMIIGDAPSADDDREGLPFVGKAGGLFDKMLFAIGLDREISYISTSVKCKPAGNRAVQRDELESCASFLHQQIQFVAPKIILVLGEIAAQSLLDSSEPLVNLRTKVHWYQDSGIPIIASYHPAELLQSSVDKRKVWQDLQLAKSLRDEHSIQS